MIGAQLLGIADEHESPLRRADPSPYRIEHRAQQRLHAPRRNVDDQPPALAVRYQREVLAQEVKMPIPLERCRRFQNGPKDLYERRQIVSQRKAVPLNLPVSLRKAVLEKRFTNTPKP